MQIASFEIPEVKLVTPRRFGDDRGFFEETYNERGYQDGGVAARFMKDNHSASGSAGTVRGLHYQAPPFAQTKLVQGLRGPILDAAVDARRGSSTCGKHVKAELSAENDWQIFVAAGFLHGFTTLEPDTHVTYIVDGYYSADAHESIRIDDPDLAIDWGPNAANPVLADKDGKAPAWASFETPFIYSHA